MTAPAIGAVCVYCGSSPGRRSGYGAAADALGDAIAVSGRSLVYGGAHVGLMGRIADRVMAGGGRVVGVIPQALVEFEVAHEGLDELIVVADMHERKARMAALADGFVAMPGGLGTLEELFEMLTWSQLGFHAKPVGVLNVEGFYDRLLDFLDQARDDGFMKPAHRALLLAEADAGALIDGLERWLPNGIGKR